MGSTSKKTAAQERRIAMQKRADRALDEQKQIARTRAEKTLQLRAIRLAREAKVEELTEETTPEEKDNSVRLPNAHRPQV